MKSLIRKKPMAIGAALLAALLGVLAVFVTTAPLAQAAPKVTVVNEFGKAEADLTYATKVTVSGSGFQSIQGGFGGIYVLFGWVKDGNWQPSQGGTTTNGSYLYVPDEETKDNAGYQRFVAFPGSDTEEAANGGTIAADGTWKTDMYIPGPTFEAVGRDGSVSEIDCRQVTCGIITIGAHGVVNKNNESFTAVKFANIYDEAPATASESEDNSSSNQSAEQITTTDTSEATSGATPTDDSTLAATTGEPTITINRDTAIVGRVLAFTASGFIEGEQVVVVLDDGIAAVGPVTTGRAGTLAAAIQLPESVRMGTHTLTITAAASGRSASVNFPVLASSTAIANTSDQAESDSSNLPSWLPSVPVLIFVLIALLVLLAAVVWRLRHRGRSKRAAQHGTQGTGTTLNAGVAADPNAVSDPDAASGTDEQGAGEHLPQVPPPPALDGSGELGGPVTPQPKNDLTATTSRSGR